MTSRERVKTAMHGKQPDRVPVFPVISDMHTTFIYDLPLYLTSVFPRLKFDLLEMAVREYGFDGFETSLGAPFDYGKSFVIGKMGKDKVLFCNGKPELKLSDENYPIPLVAQTEPIIKNASDLRKISYTKVDEYVKLGFCDEVYRLRKRFGDDAYISSAAAGFTMNGLVNMRGSEQAFIDLYEEPDFAKEILEFLTNQSIEIGMLIAESGLDCIYIGDAFASCSLISPNIFKEFCLPYYQKFTRALKPYNIDIYLHICGNSTPLFEMMAETGVNCIEPLDPLGGVRVADAKLRVGEKVCLKGGLNTITLLEGSVERTIEETKQCLAEGMKNGGYILGSGDDIPRCAKRENVRAMVETCHKYGKYL